MKQSLALVALLIMALGNAAPAGAERSPIPSKPNISDVAGDANLLADVAPDRPTPIQYPQADILAAWFTNDARTISAHWHLSAPPAHGDGVQYVIEGQWEFRDSGRRCLWFSAVFRKEDAGFYTYTALADICLDAALEPSWINGMPRVTELPDGSAILSARFPRNYSKRLADGRLLDGLRARTHYAHWIADERPQYSGRMFDLTAVGRDYRIR